MRNLRALLLRVTRLFGRSRQNREFSEELESHLDMRIGDARSKGP
jgi:hypothetical protein